MYKENPDVVVGGALIAYFNITTPGGKQSMDFTNHPLNQRNTVPYSDSKPKGSNYSNSTVSSKEILQAVHDLIPNSDYNPWYAKQLKTLGSTRFMELANKARAGSDTPHVLFKWMLENNAIVR